MSGCEGLHCPGCGHGGHGGLVVIGGGIVAAALAGEWVASHLWELLAVTAVCGALAVAAVAALMRWGDRREARHAAARPFLAMRAVPEIGTRVPAPVASAGPPALGYRDVHIHLHGVPAAEQAAVIRQALNGRN